jgi:D-cysteine desulfhydrase
MAEEEPVLFHRSPSCRSIPWTRIIEGPTPVRRLSRLGEALGGAEIWMKDDSRSAPHYGGNKPRKLEFLLEDARRRGQGRVLTAGGLGSNHCMATAIHAARLGLKTSLLLVPQPLTEAVRRQLLAFRFYGADMHLVEEYGALDARREEALAALEKAEGARPYWIPIGGSSPLGELGFVNAAMELAAQIERGEAPLPKRVYAAVGSCGTLIGLTLGFKLLGLPSRVTGVAVRDFEPETEEANAREANESLEILLRAGYRASLKGVSANDFEIVREYSGEGYAVPTAKGRQVVDLIRETEGVTLENTYTGKALSALVDAASAAPADGPYLFWNTFNAVDYLKPAEGRASKEDLPPEFQRFFEST